VTLFCSAAAHNASIGELRVLPDANHTGSSIIQKSESVWAIIALSSVKIMSFGKIVNLRLFFVKYSVIGFC